MIIGVVMVFGAIIMIVITIIRIIVVIVIIAVIADGCAIDRSWAVVRIELCV